MSLDSIRLSPAIICELFKTSLVEVKDTMVVQSLPAPSINILGKNGKHITIVVNNSDAAFLQDEELNFLLGILSACKLNMDDVGIVNIDKYPGLDYKTLATELSAEKIFLFGVPTAAIALPMVFSDYKVQAYNGITYLSAPVLSALQHDKAEKTRLWNCLKEIFSI